MDNNNRVYVLVMQARLFEPKVQVYEDKNDAIERTKDFVRAYIESETESGKVGKINAARVQTVEDIMRQVIFQGSARFGKCWVRLIETHVQPKTVLSRVFRGLSSLLRPK